MIDTTGIMISATRGIFNPADLQTDQVRLIDIALALPMLCRFGGHCPKFYSVAEHSQRVASIVSPANRLAALLHDATEAYVIDMPSPLKRALPDYQAVEAATWKVIAQALDLPEKLPEEIKQADEIVLWNELIEFFGREISEKHMPAYFHDYPIIHTRAFCLSPDEAKIAFVYGLNAELNKTGRETI